MGDDIPSFAAMHADPSRGWRAWPRWFRETDFWKSLPAEHRAVLFELFQCMASEPLMQKRSNIHLTRGQWAITWEALASLSGASVQQTRSAIRKAVVNHIIQQTYVMFRTAKATERRCVFTWLDFDSYDIVNQFANTALNRAPNTALNSISTLVPITPADETTQIKPLEEQAPLRGMAGLPAGGLSAPQPLRDQIIQRGKDDHPVPSATDLTSTAKAETAPKPAAAKVGASAAQMKAPRSSASPKASGKRSGGLTDAEKNFIRSSPVNMAWWLVAGAAICETQPDQWPALPVVSASYTAKPAAEWAEPQFATYAWMKITTARAALGEPIELPAMGKLIGTMKGAMSRHTREELVQIIDTLAGRFQEIRAGLDWPSLTLDETTLANAKVIGAAKSLMAGRPVITPTHNTQSTVTQNRHEVRPEFVADLKNVRRHLI